MKKFFKTLRKSSVVMAAALLLTTGFAGCKNSAKSQSDGGGSGAVSSTKYTVTIPATIEHGKLAVNPALPADKRVAKDTELTFTATPTDATYEVDKWTITGGTVTEGGTSGSTTAKVKVTGNISVSVTFKVKVISPTKYTVTVPATIEHGSLTVSPALPADKQVAKDTVLTFTATPTYATYEVDKWTITGVTVTEGGTPGSTTAKVKVTGNISVSVTFKEKVISSTKYTVTIPATIEHGKLAVNPALPADKRVAKDTELTFTATPTDATYEVDKWTITGGTVTEGGTPGSTTAKVKVTGNISVSVTFKAKVISPTKYTVTVPATIEHGSLTVSPALPADNQVAKDTELTFTATPTDATYEVDKWTITGGTVTEGGTPGSTTAKVKVTGNISVSVTFKAKVITPTKYTVTFSVDGGNGSLSASVDGTDISSGDAIEEGKTVDFTATPDTGYKVAGWTLNGAPVTDTKPSYSVTVEKNIDVKVRISELTETDKFINAAVKILGATIAGAEHDAAANGDLPGTGNWFKGVFIPNRTVTLSEYVMAKTEVPYWLWKEVYDWATEDKDGDGTPDHGYKFANKGKKGSKDDGSGSEKEPVTYVSWRDCIVWCNAFTEMVKGNTAECVYLTGAGGTVLKDATAKTDGNFDCDKAYFDQNKKGFRLPTEAEWEYAARQKTDGTLLPLNYLSGASANYTNEEACKKVAWYAKNSSNKTYEVGTKTANALGLYDMSGNVWEWCWDWYDDNAAAGDGGVASVSDPFGAGAGEYRVDRGGSCYYFANYCITGNRDKDSPGGGSNYRGFRLAWYK